MAGNYTFVDALERNARAIGGALALVQGRRLRTYRDLDRRANQIGHAYLELGLKRGERVALALTNGIEFVECTYGGWKDALVSVPINYRFMDAELIHVLDNSDSVGVVLEDQFLETFQRIRSQLPKIRFMLVVGKTPSEPSRQIFNFADFTMRQPEESRGCCGPSRPTRTPVTTSTPAAPPACPKAFPTARKPCSRPPWRD